MAGRALDFPAGYNLDLTPRSYEAISFQDLRNLAENYDVLRLCIETRKDQMERLNFIFKPKTLPNGEPACDAEDSRITELTKFFRRPDGVHFFGTWLRMLLEDLFVIDAPTLFKRRNRGGQLIALEPIDGATIKRVIDDWGRTPAPPVPAYQQILKGFPAVDYTTNDILYMPRNVRVSKFYGYSQVEQIIMAVNIGLRRELFQLSYYTEGTMPEALVGTPDTWTPDQIQRFQNNFDGLLAGNLAMRRRMRFIPGGVAKNYIALKEPDLTGKQDEWLARICCYAFSLPPTPFITQVNRATANSAHDAALEEGLAPVMQWVTQLINHVIEEDFGYDDIEGTWEDDQEVDPMLQMQVLTGYQKAGTLKANEVREQLGQDPVQGGDTLMVFTAQGYVPIDVNEDMPTAGEKADAAAEAAKAIANGQSPDGGKGGTGGGPGGAAPSGDAKAAQADGETPAEPDGSANKGDGSAARPFAVAPVHLHKRGLPKASKRVPMTHDTPALKRGVRSYAKQLRRAFKEMARSTTAQLLNNGYERILNKADEHGGTKLRSVPTTAAELAASVELDWTILINPTDKQLRAIGRDGSQRAIAALGIDDTDVTNQVFQSAVDYARERAAELVGMRYDADGNLIDNPDAQFAIDDTTRDDIRAAVAQALEDGVPASDLADTIADLGAFSEDRAMTIARTELIKANNKAHMATFKESGVVQYKEWSTANDDDVDEEVCAPNEDEGPIPIDDDFQSGDSEPPGHPNCRCVLIAVVGEEAAEAAEDDEEDDDE